MAADSVEGALAPIRVRPAVDSDRERLGRLAASLVDFHHRIDPSRFLPADGVADGYGKWLVRESTHPEAVVLVAEVDGQVVGYVYGRFEGRNWVDLIDAHGKIHDILVDGAARRRGIARALLEEACNQLKARGAKTIVLSTAVTNHAAQKLFEAFGFHPTMLEMTRTIG